jgi:hypothetical protein
VGKGRRLGAGRSGLLEAVPLVSFILHICMAMTSRDLVRYASRKNRQSFRLFLLLT